MKVTYFNLIISLFILISNEYLLASNNAPCNCSEEVGNCRARIHKEGNFIIVESNVAQCSRVTWYADEQPNTTVVINGREEEEWLGQNKKPFLSVDSCVVCAHVTTQEKQTNSEKETSQLLEYPSFWTQEDKVRFTTRFCDYAQSYIRATTINLGMARKRIEWAQQNIAKYGTSTSTTVHMSLEGDLKVYANLSEELVYFQRSSARNCK